MPERLDLKCGVIGDKDINRLRKIPTLLQVITLIESKYTDPNVRAKLIQKAHEYPRGAMEQFVKNIRKFAIIYDG